MVNEAGFVIVPVPFDVQAKLLWFVALDPGVIFTAAELEQVDTAVPATAVGAAVMVNILFEVALPHGEFPIAVRVNVTLPAVISAALAAYVAKVNEVALVNVPVPLEVHVTPLLLVALDPAVIFTAPALEQVAIAVPATAAGAAVIVSVLVDVAAAQVPFPLAVNVKVTLPAAISAALGV